MTSLDDIAKSANEVDAQRIQMLVIGRLIAVFLLLVTSWIWYSGRLVLSVEDFPRDLFIVFIISVGLTGVYFFLPRLSSRLAWQFWLQFSLDALLITWLVDRSGDVSSPYITLYIVLIAISSIYLKPRATLALAGICAALFSLFAILVSTGVTDRASDVPQAKIVQIVSFNLVAFLVVGLLATRLSERRSSGDELRETAKTLANLRALHQLIVESIRSGLIVTDLDGKIYTFNAAAAEITGRAVEEMQGRSILELFGDISEAIELSMQRGDHAQPPRFETDLTTPDGFAVHVGYNISPLIAESGEPTGLIVSFQDLTEIRSMEESIRRKDRLAAVGRVGAGLAHEIRNPLGAMRGAIQVLESSTAPGSVQSDLMSIILRESDRLNTIITNFLNYSKPSVGSFVEVDLGEAVTDTVTLLKHSPDVSAWHTIETSLPPSAVFVSADPTQLKQVFWNLARNAIQAMPDGGTLRIKVEPLANRRVRIVFEDTGRGMSPEQVERLFEPFSPSATGGTGLGLSIVYQIIRDHNGTINVSSFEGEGTTITIVLQREAKSSKPGTDGRADAGGDALPIEDYLKVRSGE
ncbi:MAG: two-component system sensor histidine kinase NtrB [Pyrinomonadaceae bacterium]